jgi:hypothetical protein
MKPRTSVTATVRLRRPLQPVDDTRTETAETHRKPDSNKTDGSSDALE